MNCISLPHSGQCSPMLSSRIKEPRFPCTSYSLAGQDVT
jgi:hypothetical protein